MLKLSDTEMLSTGSPTWQVDIRMCFLSSIFMKYSRISFYLLCLSISSSDIGCQSSSESGIVWLRRAEGGGFWGKGGGAVFELEWSNKGEKQNNF